MPPTPIALPARIIDAQGVEIALVPAGEFQMGSDADDALAECQKYSTDCSRNWFVDEEPVHTVYLDDFYMDIYEVTNALYEKCVQAGVCSPPGETSSYSRRNYYSNSQFDDYPVIYVDWEQAQTFCKWRGAHLPTEAEWEKVTRGTDGLMYPWGDTFDGSRVNYCDKNCWFGWADKNNDDGYADTAPAGSYPAGASPYGVLDMAGNVWEWVADWYDAAYYKSSPDSNPTGPASGEYQVVRGGSWIVNDYDLRAASRGRYAPGFPYLFGFRCARSP